MKILPIGYRKLLRSLEQRLANQVEQRKDKSIEAHLAALANKGTKRRQGKSEPMPYRLHIAVAFAWLTIALASLYAWYP